MFRVSSLLGFTWTVHLYIMFVELLNCCVERRQTLFHRIFGPVQAPWLIEETCCIYWRDVIKGD